MAKADAVEPVGMEADRQYDTRLELALLGPRRCAVLCSPGQLYTLVEGNDFLLSNHSASSTTFRFGQRLHFAGNIQALLKRLMDENPVAHAFARSMAKADAVQPVGMEADSQYDAEDLFTLLELLALPGPRRCTVLRSPGQLYTLVEGNDF